VKQAAADKDAKGRSQIPRELNVRVGKYLHLYDGKTKAASLLNQKYSDPSMQASVGQKVQIELNLGRFAPDRNGGKTVILDMKEPTGWIVKLDRPPSKASPGAKTDKSAPAQEPQIVTQEATKLDVRIDNKGSWHFFPTL
jgi:hypothetical protein